MERQAKTVIGPVRWGGNPGPSDWIRWWQRIVQQHDHTGGDPHLQRGAGAAGHPRSCGTGSRS